MMVTDNTEIDAKEIDTENTMWHKIDKDPFVSLLCII